MVGRSKFRGGCPIVRVRRGRVGCRAMLFRPTHSLRMLAVVAAAGAIHAAPAAAAADPDTTPPEITVTVPAEGQVFDSSQGPVATSFACADEAGGSGMATCDGAATLDTTKHGDQTFIVHTTD